jgi:hypothetical protein
MEASTRNPLKPKLVYILFKNSVRTEKKTTRLNYKDQLVNAVKKITAVYSENHTKHISTLCGQNTELLIIKAGGTHSS